MSTASIEFTKASLKALSITGKRYEVRDTEISGLRCEVHPSGKKIIRVVKRVPGTKRIAKVRLGNLSDFETIKQIQKTATKAIVKINDGINPTEEKKARKATDKEQAAASELEHMTFQQAFNTWAKQATVKEETMNGYLGAVRIHLKDVKDRPMKAWLNWDGLHALRAVILKNAPGRAQFVMSLIQNVLSHARSRNREFRHLLPEWPFITASDRKEFSAPMKLKRREGCLPLDQPDQFHLWLDAVDLLPLLYSNRTDDGELWRDYFKLILFTGLRRQEARNLTWENVDFKNASIHIPLTKNGDPLTTPLTTFTKPLLEAIWERSGCPESGDVFGLSTDVKTPMTLVEGKCGFKNTIHDLRRTFATAASEAGVPESFISELMNHRKSDANTTQGYIRNFNIAHLRAPAQQVTDYILAI